MQPVTTPRVFSGRYELTHLIARGGMAQVYRAHDRLLDRPVALKVLFPELSVDRAFVERFRREAQAAANLSHPNIVPVFDWGEDGGTYFIVMEFVDGEPLSATLRNGGPLPPGRVAQIGARVADALAYAHRHGVVHRDVKPGNVLLTDDEQVKVTDFGIARAINTEESLTQTGAVMGTATYFSPEQAEGVGVDARSDIYSLGVVLFEMVAGRPPFLGETPVSIASKHVRDRPPVLRDLNPTVPPDLEAIVAKAMAKTPDLRYQSASDLQADLQRFAAGRPVTIAPAAATAVMAGGGMAATGVMGSLTATHALPVDDGRDAAPAERSTTWRWVALLIALLVVLALVVFFLLRALGYIGTSSFSMPTVRGKTVPAATSALEGKGLDVVGTKAETSRTVHATDVISTKPSVGTLVSKGHHVTLVVSSGAPAPSTVQVPTVKTKTVTTAESALRAAGLVPTVHQQSSTRTSGTVLDVTPAAGTKVKKGAKVTLTVSKQGTVPVPDVIGDNIYTAGSKLGSAGLIAGTTSYACSNQYPTSGVVIATSPADGQKVALKTVVNLVVSSGPCTAVVPTVKGQTGTSAKATLSSKGFSNVSAVSTTSCNAGTNGKVVSQTPGGGKSEPTSSAVTLTVCSAPTPTSTSTTTSSTAQTTTKSGTAPAASPG
jgi:eukaryotic-like serine/threonine-protein kinase